MNKFLGNTILGLSLMFVVGACKQSEDTNTLALSVEDHTIDRDESIYVEATGGEGSYEYFISSGGGSINESSGYFNAPNYDDTVEIGVEDAVGNLAYLTIYVDNSYGSSSSSNSSSVYFNLNSKTVLGKQSLRLKASGGNSPYSYEILSGSGKISGTSYVADDVEETEEVSIMVTDADGYTDEVEIEVVPAKTLSATSKVWVDHKVGVTFDAHGEDGPQLVLFGTGAALDASALGANGSACKPGAFQEIDAPCAIKIPLTNLSTREDVENTYVGSVSVEGRNKNISFDFCVKPGDASRAYIKWKSSNEVSVKTISYNRSNETLLDGRKMTAAFNVVDTSGGAAYANIVMSSAAYTDSTDCGSNFKTSIYALSE